MTRRVRRWTTGLAATVGLVVSGAWPALALPTATLDGDRVDRAVTDVLTRPAYANARPGWFAQLRDRIRTWFLERLADLFGSGAGTVIAWVLVGLLVVVAVAVLVRVVIRTRRGGALPEEPALHVVATRPPDAWLADARLARAQGDLAEAVRCAYRAIVALLARQGAVDEVPGRTVGEYRRQVAARAPARSPAFARASDTFERVWYARRPADPDEVDRVLAVAATLEDRP